MYLYHLGFTRRPAGGSESIHSKRRRKHEQMLSSKLFSSQATCLDSDTKMAIFRLSNQEKIIFD